MENSLENFFNNYFYKNNDEYLGIIINKDISNFFKIEIISLKFFEIFDNIFKKYPEIIPYVNTDFYGNKTYFELLINYYLSNIKNESIEKLNNFIHDLLFFIEPSIEIFENIFQFIKKNIQTFDEKIFNSIFELLNILYENKSKKIHSISYVPKNYIFHNGINNSFIQLINKNNFKNQNEFQIHLWFYFQYSNMNFLKDCSIIKFGFNKNVILLNLTDFYTKFCFIDGDKKKEIANVIPKEWIYINVKLCSKKMEINFYQGNLNIKFGENISNGKLNFIFFFNNFFGISTSIIINKNKINFKDKEQKMGFYKEKNNIKDYLIQNNIKSNENNLISFLVPIYYYFDEDENCFVIEDIYKNNDLKIVDKYSLIIKKNNIKQIQFLGGIKSILPILELIFINKEKNIFFQKNFENYLILINIILDKKNNSNFINAIQEKFFESLSLFLEKIPNEYYSNIIYNNFIKLHDNFISFLKKNPHFLKNKYSFLENIFMNLKIIFKFNYENQNNIIKTFIENYKSYEIIKNDKKIINLNKIIIILRKIDSEKFKGFCCEKHARLFKNYNKNEILNPQICERLEIFSEIIINLIDNSDSEEIINLFKLLILDISPCLQYFLINNIILIYFHKLTDEQAIENYLNKDFLIIILYVYSISLIDIKTSILNLLFVIFEHFPNSKNKVKINNDLIDFTEFINLFLSEIFLMYDLKLNNDEINKKYIKKLTFNEKNNENYLKLKKEFEINIENKKIFDDFLIEKHNDNNSKNLLTNGIKNINKNYNINFINIKEQEMKNNNLRFEIENKLLDDYFLFKFLNEREKNKIKYLNNDNLLLKLLDENNYYLQIKSCFNQLLINIKPTQINLIIEIIIKILINFNKNSLINLFFSAIDNKLNEIKKILKSNFKFIDFLLRKLLNSFEEENSNILMNLLKKIIFTNLNDESIKIITYIINWAYFEYKINIKNYNKIYKLVKNLLLNGIDFLIDLIHQNKFKLNDKNSLNFYLFMNLVYEFIITFNEKFLQETINKFKLKNYLEIDKDSHSIIPSFAINGQEDFTNNCDWKNCEFLEKIITLFNELFSVDSYGFNDCYKIKDIINKNYNKKDNKEKNVFIENEFEYVCGTFVYTYDHNLKEIIKGLSLIIIISNLFFIYFCIESSKKEVLEQYEKFIMYLIILNLKNKKLTQENYEINLTAFISCLLYFIDNISNERYKKFIDNLADIIICNIFLEIRKKKKEIKNILILDDILLTIFYKYLSNFNNDKKFFEFFEFYKKNFNLETKNDKSIETNDIMNELLENKEIHDKLKNLFNTKYLYSKYKERIKKLEKYPFLNKKNKNENEIFDENNFNILKNYNLNKEKLFIQISNLTDFYIKIFYKNKKLLYENHIKNKNIYKNIKKNLFSYNGLWSEKKIFFEKEKENSHNLKYKIVHHYSKELVLPLTKLILDINDYLPNFSLFKKENLFLNNEYFSIVNLNIEKILNSNFINKNSEKNSNKNYLYNIYFYNTKNVFEKYKQINSLEKKENLELSNDNFYINILDKNEKYFKCCLVKISSHIKGYLKTGKTKLKFNYFNFDLSKNKFDYDYERHCCFGSFITNSEKDKNYKKIIINLDDITYVLKKKYYYNDKALEIFTNKNKSYYFNFIDQKSRDKIIDYIINKNYSPIKIFSNENNNKENKEKIIGYSNLKYSNVIKNIDDLNNKYSNYEISTLEYLILNNLFSYRSFKDISQYPIFPWIFIEYEKNKINKNDPNFKRNLKLPMGMLELNEYSIERKNYYIQEYESRKKPSEEEFENNNIKKLKKNKNAVVNSDAHFYGSTFSNPAYVSHYLIRIFPFTIVGIEIQGNNFDSSDRLFFNIITSFYCAATQQCDLRELIPEFFYLPDFLFNFNSLNLNLKNEKQNVIIPKWSKNPFDFIRKHRKYLERNNDIPNWINLFFGYKQQGKEAEKSCNIYSYHCYQNNINLNNLKFKEDFILYNRLFEIGVLPNQIYKDKKSVSKRKENYNKMKFFLKNKSNELKFEYKPFYKKNEKFNVIYFKISNESKKYFLYYSNHLINLINIDNNKKINEYSNKENDEELKKMNFVIETEKNKVVQFFNKSNYYILSENYEGTFLFIENNSNKKEINKKIKEIKFEKKSLITNIAIDSDDKYVYISTTKGSLLKYEFTKKYDLLYKKQKNDHRAEIVHIFLNNELNLLATAGKDKIINIYTLPKLKLNRSIKLNFNPSLIFISNGFLPSIVVYEKNENDFFIYSINGMFIGKKSHFKKKYKISCYTIYKDYYCNEYLILGISEGFIEIYKLPFMKLVRDISIEQKNIKFINILDNGRKIISVSSDGMIYVMNIFFKELEKFMFKNFNTQQSQQ